MRSIILFLGAFLIGIISAKMGYSMIASATNFLAISGICIVWCVVWKWVAKKFNIK